MSKTDKTLDRFWDMPQRDLLVLLEATPAGLTSDEAKQRLRLHGPNSLVAESRFAPVISFLRFLPIPWSSFCWRPAPFPSCWAIRLAAPSSSP